jgi:hypothetical protein
MARSGKPLERAKPATTDLESYRRLVELQKEIVELAEQYKLSKRQRDELFAKVVREVDERWQNRNSVRRRLQQAATRLLERSKLPGTGPMLRWRALLRRS